MVVPWTVRYFMAGDVHVALGGGTFLCVSGVAFPFFNLAISFYFLSMLMWRRLWCWDEGGCIMTVFEKSAC